MMKSHPHHRYISVTCKPEKQLIRDVSFNEKLFSLNPCKISRKLLIKKRDYSNAAGATLLKSLSDVDILL